MFYVSWNVARAQRPVWLPSSWTTLRHSSMLKPARLPCKCSSLANGQQLSREELSLEGRQWTAGRHKPQLLVLMDWCFRRSKGRVKKRKTTGVKPGGGLEEENIFFFTFNEERLEKWSKAKMFDSAALRVIIVQTHSQILFSLVTVAHRKTQWGKVTSEERTTRQCIPRL